MRNSQASGGKIMESNIKILCYIDVCFYLTLDKTNVCIFIAFACSNSACNVYLGTIVCHLCYIKDWRLLKTFCNTLY